MSDTHGMPAADEPHVTATHDPHGVGDHDHDETGHGGGHDEHGNVAEPLGPIDWAMWGTGVLGIIVAAAVTAAFMFSTGFELGA